MQYRTAYTEWPDKVAVTVYRNICVWIRSPQVQKEHATKSGWVQKSLILWNFKFQSEKQLLANQPDIRVVDKEQKRAVVIDVTIPADSNIKKKEHKKIKKYQALKEQLEQMWKLKSTVFPVEICTLGAVTPKRTHWLRQIPGTTSKVCVQMHAGTATVQNRQTFLW